MSYINFISFSVTGDCTNSSIGEIQFTITGDSPTWTVSEISPYSGLIPTSGLTPGNETYYVGGLPSGVYSVQIQDTSIPPNGPVTITNSFVISSGTTVSLYGDDTTCDLNNGSLSAYTDTFYGSSTFELYDLLGNYIDSGQTPYGQAYLIFPNLSADTYYVIGNDGGGCTGRSESVIIRPSTSFTYGYYAVDDASCVAGQSSGKIFLTGLTPSSAYTINWVSNVNGQSGTTVTGLTQGVYVVDVTNDEGCTVQETIQIDNVLQVGLGLIQTTPPGCFLNDGEVTIIITGGTAPFYYYGSNGDSYITFDSTQTFTGLTAGLFSITVTDAGLCSFTEQVNLVTPNSFGVVSVSTTNSNCNSNNGSVYITINNGIGNGNYNYTLSGTNGSVQYNVNGGLTQTFQAATGDYVIFIDNGTGCVYTGSTSVYNVDKFTITGSTTGTTCGLNNGVLSVSVSTGATLPLSYQLVGPTTNPQSQTQLNGNFINLTSGNYSLNITDGTGCQQSTSVYITPSSSVYFDFVTLNPVIGNDGVIYTLITSGTPPFTYYWTGNVGSQTGSTITGLTSGSYSLTIVDVSGCTYTKTTTLTGTQMLGSYSVFNLCDQNFVDSGIIGRRGIKQMFNEGFYDLTSGDTNCMVNYATFTLQVDVGTESVTNLFYYSTGINDYPSDVLWADTLTNILNSFIGVGQVTIDYVNNKITITNDCEEISKNCTLEKYNLLNDTNFVVNLIINYNISCVVCS